MAKMIKLMVTGGRDYTDYAQVVRVLTPFAPWPVTLIHGACRWYCQKRPMEEWVGADMLCERFALSEAMEGKWSIWRWPANWHDEGRPAGSIRNHRMIDGAKPHVVIGFPGGRGTADACSYAQKMHIPVVRTPDAPTDADVGKLALAYAGDEYERRKILNIMRGE